MNQRPKRVLNLYFRDLCDLVGQRDRKPEEIAIYQEKFGQVKT